MITKNKFKKLCRQKYLSSLDIDIYINHYAESGLILAELVDTVETKVNIGTGYDETDKGIATIKKYKIQCKDGVLDMIIKIGNNIDCECAIYDLSGSLSLIAEYVHVLQIHS